MVHDRNCKVRMVGCFLLRNILAVGDILWAYFLTLETTFAVTEAVGLQQKEF